MKVTDFHGKAYIAAYNRARNEYRQLIYAANNAAEYVVDDLYSLEVPENVHYPVGADVESIKRKHMRFFASGAKEAIDAVNRSKRALLDVLAYVDGVEGVPTFERHTVESVDHKLLDHKRVVFFSNALEVSKMFSAQRVDTKLCARTLASADDLIQAVGKAAEQWIPEDLKPAEMPKEWSEKEKLPY